MTALYLGLTLVDMEGRCWPVQGSVAVTNVVSAAVSGVVMVTQPIVNVLLADGSPDLSYVGPVTLSAVGGVLNGTLTVNAVAGAATFVGLSITGSGQVVLTASAPQRLPGVSAAISVS